MVTNHKRKTALYRWHVLQTHDQYVCLALKMKLNLWRQPFSPARKKKRTVDNYRGSQHNGIFAIFILIFIAYRTV